MPYLSHLLGQRVIDSVGQLIGKIVDLAITVEEPFGGEFPPVTLVLVRAGRIDLRLRSEAIADWDALEAGRAVLLDQPRARLTVGREKESEIYLRRDVLDKQILDVSNARLVRVNDVFLTEDREILRAAGVDVSLRGLLRRVRLETPTMRFSRRVGLKMPRQHIPWNQVEVMRGDEGGRIISRVPADKLSKLHPSDLANIVAQMTPTERAELIEQLDDETVALALEESDDEVAADIIENLDVERAADIIEEMDPDEAADILGEIESEERADAILDALDDPEEAADIKHLLSYEEGTAGALMNTDVTNVRLELSCEGAIQFLRAEDASPQTLSYLYLEDEHGKLCGVVSLAQVVLARPETALRELISQELDEELISVSPDTPTDECARLIAKYDLLSLPVVDLSGALLGLVTVDDILDEIAPDKWKLPRMVSEPSQIEEM